MATLQLTQVYLEPSQKKALGEKAKSLGVKPSELIREAVNTYLAGVTVDELMLLDRATKQAGDDFAAMNSQLDETNTKLDRVFEEIDLLHRKAAA